LVDAGADLAAIQAGIDSLGLASCRLVAAEVKKRGFRAVQITVEHEPAGTRGHPAHGFAGCRVAVLPGAGSAHRHLHQITAMIDRGTLSPQARGLATRIFQRLAEAEAKVHGTTIEQVHFHEVGAVDSIADIVGAAIAFDLLGVQRVVCSPVPTGHGFVEIAHGRSSIPAPATAELLRGVPIAACDVEGELTTPTGAAIVAALAAEFGPLPSMTIERIGCGAGQKDFGHANLLRILLGEGVVSEPVGPTSAAVGPRVESIILLETNLDDTPGEAIGHCVDRLWAAGALDVTLVPVQMKKGRPGVLVSVQARPAEVDSLEAILFQETTTLGVRRLPVVRTVLARRPHEVTTPWGPVAGKIAYLPDGSPRFTPEYAACRQVSAQQNLPLAQVMFAAQQAFQAADANTTLPTQENQR
jgi:hypothetical protein